MTGAREHHLVDNLEEALALSRKSAPRELLKTPSMNRLLLDALADWSIIVAAWLAMSALPAITYPIFALIVSSRLHAFGVILHDVVHMPLRRKSLRARILEIFTGYPIATTLNAMRYHHIRHHRDSGMKTDPYFKAGIEDKPMLQLAYTARGLLLFPFWTIRGVVGSVAYYVPALRNAYARLFLQDRSGENLRDSREVLQCAAEDRWQLSFHLLLLPVALLETRAFMLGYVVPAILAGLFGAYRLMMEHAYMAATDRKLETIIATTADHNLSGFGRFFLAPRNIGYHIVHHLHPQVAWYELPRLRAWYRDNFPQQYPQQPQPPWHVFASALGAQRR